jgi:hypothetical protein
MAPLRGFRMAAFIKHLPTSRHIRRFFLNTRHDFRTSSIMSTDSNSTYKAFFRYLIGRWLWDEKTQLQKRYNRFNVLEL